MRRVSKGYTIVEVMIFLAVSLAILVASMNLISGKQSETEFNQKMRDTRSKIQDWLNDVSTGFTGGDPDSMSCTKGPGGVPFVASGSPSTAPICIFLGKAIQFTDENNKTTGPNQDENLYVYSIFGCLRQNCSGSDTAQASTSLTDSTPTAAVGLRAQSGVTESNLTETFSLAPAHVTKVTAVDTAGKYGYSHMIGFFNTFNSEQNDTANGAEDLAVYDYDFKGDDKPADQGGIGNLTLKCLEFANPCNSAPQPLKSYKVCLSDGRRTAQLTISSSAGIGATTDLEYVAC
jgi:hypothetical protein